MAHFKRGNLQLKTNQQIQLGDSQESLIKYDGTQLSLSHGAIELALDATGVIVIGDVTADSYYGDGSTLTGVLRNVVEDTSPQLGGDLDVAGNSIVGAPPATPTSVGGPIAITAGDGGVTSGDAGSITITAGDYGGTADDGGFITLQPGNGQFVHGRIVFLSRDGSLDFDISSTATTVLLRGEPKGVGDDTKNIVFSSGDTQTTGAAGSMSISGGGTSGGGGSGGGLSLSSGSGGTGGNVTVQAGDSVDVATPGGAVTIEAGLAGGAGSAGGLISLTGGIGNTTGDGGAISLTAGAGGTTGDGGDILMTPGGNTAGADGAINITQTTAPSVTTDRLYNVAGALTWEGKNLTSELYFGVTKVVETIATGVTVNGTVSADDPTLAAHLTTLGYMARLGTDRVRLTYDGTANLDISIEHIIDVKYTDFNINEAAPEWQEGRVFWDRDNNTFGVYNDVAEVTLQVGQETHIKVRNESGVLIPDGTVCYIVGASADRATILPAIATSEPTSEGIIVATHDISHNEDGYGTIIGRVGSQDTSAFAEGAEIYLSPFVAGAITDVRPTAPNYVVDIGNVIVSDSTVGSLLVHILNHGDFASLADVNIPIPPTSGQTLTYNEDDMYWQPETQAKIISYTLPLSGVSDSEVPLTGTFITKATGVTGDDTTDYPISNQHVWILINSITGADSTGTITVTGTSLSESTAVPVPADTEIITVDSTAGVYYQTDKKWWEITNIAISGDISAIDYDHGALGYPDMGNRNFKILGYRMDAFASGINPDMRLIISKVHDLGDKKVEFINLEDIGVDSGTAGNQIVDHVRTGGSDRSYDPAVTNIWLNDETFTFKQLDFDTYWSNDENEIFSADENSGYFIRIEGEPAGISNVDFLDLLLYYALL